MINNDWEVTNSKSKEIKYTGFDEICFFRLEEKEVEYHIAILLETIDTNINTSTHVEIGNVELDHILYNMRSMIFKIPKNHIFSIKVENMRIRKVTTEIK